MQSAEADTGVGAVVVVRRRPWRVERVLRRDDVVRLDVVGLGGGRRRRTFLVPFDRPQAVEPSRRLAHARPERCLARIGALIARAPHARLPTSTVTADVTILPHQIEPALAVRHGAERVLIADEVGLGKTIQAGVIIDEIVRRDAGARLLVIAPAGLRTQWQDELRRRFSVDSWIADQDALDRLARSTPRGENPWRQPGVWISSIDFLKQAHVLAALPPAPWDLVVIDEAHDACGRSDRHDAANAVACRARRVVLLTATPHGGDEARFSRLLDLGAVLPGNTDRIVVFRRTRRDLSWPVVRRVRWHRVSPSDAGARLFDALAEYEASVLRAAGTDRRDAALLLLSVLRKRALSTASAFEVSIERRLIGHERHDEPEWTQPQFTFDDPLDDDGLTGGEGRALLADVGLDHRRERAWLRRLQELGRAATRSDSKVRRVAALVERAHEPVVIFTEFRDSLNAVRDTIARLAPVACLHGGLSAAEARRELDAFLTGTARVLIATDVAGQGLNLQMRARWIINLELPWAPVRLEQRAGRVDRIGQRRPVHVTSLVWAHAAESELLRRLARRVLDARSVLGGDALDAALPGDDMIRAEILEKTAHTGPRLNPLPPPRIVTCRRWSRAARVVARRLRARQALSARWRGIEIVGRPARSSLRTHPVLRRLAPGGLAVFSAAILDKSGALLERHIVAIRLENPHSDSVGATEIDSRQLDCARNLAARQAARRAARLGRWMRTVMPEPANARERAIVDAMVAAQEAGGQQTGLFDRREARQSARAVTEVAGIRDAARNRADRMRLQHDVIVGRIALECVLAGR